MQIFTRPQVVGHSQVHVDLAAADGQYTGTDFENTFIIYFKPGNHLVHHLGILMSHIAIARMTNNSHLDAINHYVGNTAIVRVEFESFLLQAIGELVALV
jgi:hypothetical protein